MKKIGLVFLTLLILLLPTPLYADMGPKPVVYLTINNINEKCYATLLSKDKASGPHQLYDGTEKTKRNNSGSEDIWKAFVDYQDENNYYFLQYFEEVTNGEFSWIYYPPDEFKILLYFPESNHFVTNDKPIQRYAFNSYYTVTLSQDKKNADVYYQTNDMIVKDVYGFTWFNQDFLGRVIITVGLELVIALLFHLRKLKYIGVIIAANIFTQFILNTIINFIHFQINGLPFILYYIGLECLVTFIELLIYHKSFKDIETKTILMYTIIANLATFNLGLLFTL